MPGLPVTLTDLRVYATVRLQFLPDSLKAALNRKGKPIHINGALASEIVEHMTAGWEQYDLKGESPLTLASLGHDGSATPGSESKRR